MTVNTLSTSKFLSLILRHKPQSIGLELDDEGWADIEQLLRLSNAQGRQLTRPLIDMVVETSDKHRFAISCDGLRIRANQGHSVSIDLGLIPVTPPPVLFHGTSTRFRDSIKAQGLLKGNRHHVHLSADESTARKVGSRHGKPIVLRVSAASMHAQGHVFFCSSNGVWLTSTVPSDFFEVIE